MRTLVIDTATAACSIALIADGAVVDARHQIVGRGHAERLVPMMACLPEGGRAERILVDVGPGSFTGIRVGLAAARAFGLAWDATVAGYSSLAIIAAAAFAAGARAPLAVVLEGGHGEVFMQGYALDGDLAATDALVSLSPAAAIAALAGRDVIGNGVRFLTPLAPDLPARPALPDARDALRLPMRLATLPPTPLYGRAPDAVPAR